MRIAFTGAKGSGKTTCAEYLENIYGFTLLSFSDKLKVNLVDAGIDPEVLYGQKTAASRLLMQMYGDCIREEDPDYFVCATDENICEAEAMGETDIVLDDPRRNNEKWYCDKSEFVLVRVEMLGYNQEPDPHPTENEWRDWEVPYVIQADRGDIVGLYGQVDEMINELIKKGG